MLNQDDFQTQTNRFFDSLARTYDSTFFRFYFGPLGKRIISLIAEERLIPSPGRVLDVGCGTGEMLFRLATKNPLVQFVGVDPSSAMLGQAKAKIGSLSNVQLIEGEAQVLPFKNEEFDLVLSSEAFHHIWDPERSLLEMRRVLKPRGALLLVDPGADTWFQKLIFRRLGPLFETHKHVYTQVELGAFLSEAGFKSRTTFRYWMNNYVIADKAS